MQPLEEVLQDLTQPSNVSTHSDDVLARKVKAAIAADDKKPRAIEDEPLRFWPRSSTTYCASVVSYQLRGMRPFFQGGYGMRVRR